MTRQGKARTPLSGYCIVRNDLRLREIIKYYMGVKGYNYTSLSERLDLNDSNIRKFVEKGMKTVSQYNVIRICDELGIEISLEIDVKK